MRIALTGATGFIGRHVTTALAKPGLELVAVVRPDRQGTVIAPGIETLAMDFADCRDDTFDRLGRPDAMIHLAWGGLPNYRDATHLDEELPRQRRFLESCARGGLKHLLVTGTCLEYGMREGELREDMPAQPGTAYARAKDQLRLDLMRWRNELGFGLVWLRMFYLYGAGQAPSSLYSQLNAAIDRGDEIFPMSPGDQSRDFLPVGEAAGLIVALAARLKDAGVVNLCSGEPATVLSMARRWRQERHADIALETGRFPYPTYEPFAFWGSRAKLNQLLEAP